MPSARVHQRAVGHVQQTRRVPHAGMPAPRSSQLPRKSRTRARVQLREQVGAAAPGRTRSFPWREPTAPRLLLTREGPPSPRANSKRRERRHVVKGRRRAREVDQLRQQPARVGHRRRRLVAEAPTSTTASSRATPSTRSTRGCRSCTACSTPLENPNVVLIMIGAANLFSRSKAPSRIAQFVPKRDLRLTVRTLGSPRDHQSVSFPPQAGRPSTAKPRATRVRPSITVVAVSSGGCAG